MTLQSSQRLPELLFYTKKSYKILQLQSYTCTLHYNPENSPSRIHSTCRRQRALRVLQSSSRNSTHRRQGDLLEMHPCVLQDIPGNSSCSRDIQDIPVIHDLPAFQAILQCSSISRESTPFQHSPIRMHILHILHILQFLQFDWFPQKTPPSTSWAITDITNIHSSKKGRCCDIGQIDRLFIIELFPLSSCQVIILIARMTFNCSTSCLMS